MHTLRTHDGHAVTDIAGQYSPKRPLAERIALSLRELWRGYKLWELRKVEEAVKAIPGEERDLKQSAELRHAMNLVQIEHEAARRILEGTQRMKELKMELGL